MLSLINERGFLHERHKIHEADQQYAFRACKFGDAMSPQLFDREGVSESQG
jgi:hypothetical protein